ncbi:MAG: hypothetical protein AAGM67_21545, partial [Bacteroidota bacterium]
SIAIASSDAQKLNLSGSTASSGPDSSSLAGGVDAGFLNDPTQITNPLLQGTRTIYGMLTNDGKDRSGNSSEVYIISYGDNTAGSRDNNGAFKVIGLGTTNMTLQNASNSTSVLLQPLSADFSGFNIASTGSVTVEFRSQFTRPEDGNGSLLGPSALAIVLTDLEGKEDHPWNETLLGDPSAGGQAPDYSLLPNPSDKLVISTTLQYNPGRPASPRVPDDIWRFSIVNAGAEYLRRSRSAIDTSFSSESGVP